MYLKNLDLNHLYLIIWHESFFDLKNEKNYLDFRFRIIYIIISLDFATKDKETNSTTIGIKE